MRGIGPREIALVSLQASKGKHVGVTRLYAPAAHALQQHLPVPMATLLVSALGVSMDSSVLQKWTNLLRMCGGQNHVEHFSAFFVVVVFFCINFALIMYFN